MDRHVGERGDTLITARGDTGTTMSWNGNSDVLHSEPEPEPEPDQLAGIGHVTSPAMTPRTPAAIWVL